MLQGKMGNPRAHVLTILRAECFCQAVLQPLSAVIDGEVVGGCWAGAHPWEPVINLGPLLQVVKEKRVS